jgi:hypothetical protein
MLETPQKITLLSYQVLSDSPCGLTSFLGGNSLGVTPKSI